MMAFGTMQKALLGFTSSCLASPALFEQPQLPEASKPEYGAAQLAPFLVDPANVDVSK